MNRIKFLATVLIGLNTFDAVSTFIAVQGGIAHELNPMMRALLDFHPASFLVFKFVIGTTLVFFLWMRAPGRIKAMTITLAGLVGVYSVLFLQHLRVWLALLLC